MPTISLTVIASLLAALCLMGLYAISHHVKKATNQVEPVRPPGMGDPIDKATLHPDIYRKVIFAVLIAAIAIECIAVALWQVIPFSLLSFGFNLGFPVALIPAVYVAFSLRKVDTNERGALYFYGIALKNVGSGLHFVLPFLFTLEKYPVNLKEIIEPAPRDSIFWGDEKEPLPPGKVRPIYVIAHSQTDVSKEAGDTGGAPLNVQRQYGVAYYVLWSVSSDVATFRQNSLSIQEAEAQIKAVSLTLLAQIIGSRTTEGVIAKQQEVNDDFVNALREQAVGMGIRIHKTGLQDFNISHEMAKAMRDRAEAEFAAQTVIIGAEADAKRIKMLGKAEGKANREREKGTLEGRAKGMAKIAKKLKVSGNATLASETVREGWPKSTVIAGAGPGTADLVAAVKTVATVYGADKKED